MEIKDFEGDDQKKRKEKSVFRYTHQLCKIWENNSIHAAYI